MKFLKTVLARLLNIVCTVCKWLGDRWYYVIMLMCLDMYLIWRYSFFQNGEHGAKFELNSIWMGFSTVCGASVVGLGKMLLELKKYRTDSENNTQQGQLPDQSGISFGQVIPKLGGMVTNKLKGDGDNVK